MMTFNEFKDSWEKEILPEKSTQMREGQALINYLAKIWFNEYKRLVNNYYKEDDINCFYQDTLINNTLDHLEKVWSKYPN